ncbi:MAG: hypothetical protein H6R19_3116 [Proteobacteria bacterium]|nr:hypothetical protein [Pseudomonadota bacterium]
MSTYALLEPVLVGLIVAASAGFALRRTLPRQFARLGSAVRQARLPDWLGALLGKLFPEASECSSGCGSCSNCGTSSPPPTQVVVFHRHKHDKPS